MSGTNGLVMGRQNLQGVYRASLTPPHLTVDTIGGALTVDSDGTQTEVLEIRASASRSHIIFDAGLSTGRGGMRHLPDDYTVTTLPTVTYALQWDSTVTSDITGGGGIGNDTAPAMVGAVGTCVLADQGNLFSTSLLFNQGTNLQLQANAGPVYTLVNQPTIFADGGSFSCSQHNALRIQPRWGANINGGSITQTSAVYILNTATVDATVGSASVTDLVYWQAASPTLTAGGTIGTFTALDLANISGPSTITGIRSAMSSGNFIRHTGTSAVQLGGQLQLGSGTTFDVIVSRGAANRMDLASGDSMRIISGQLQFVNANTYVTGGASQDLRIQGTRIGFNVAPGAVDTYMTISAPARTASAGGSDIAHCLNSSGGSVTFSAAYTNYAQWIVNAPSSSGTAPTNAANLIVQTSVSHGTNRYGVYISANPTGGTINHPLRVQSGISSFNEMQVRPATGVPAQDRYVQFDDGTNQYEVHCGTDDPTSTGGAVTAPVGSLYMRNNGGTGEVWGKTGAAATAWTQIV